MSGDCELNPGPPLLVTHNNVRSICPRDRSMRLDEIESTLCVSKNVDILTISETWLKKEIPDDDVAIDNYSLFRKDRSETTANEDEGGYGGVCIYARNSLPVKRCKELEQDNVEIIFIK